MKFSVIQNGLSAVQAHIEYFRGISNPIGVKVGESPSCGRMAGGFEEKCLVKKIPNIHMSSHDMPPINL